MASVGALARGLVQTARYNRDWGRYLWARWARQGDDRLLTYRLRNGQRILLRGSVRSTLNEIFLHRVYDVPGVDFSRCRVVFDFGANMGVFSLYVAAQAPDARIACFEPASSNFSILERNLLANRVNARAYRLAVSTSCDSGRFGFAGHSGQYRLGWDGETFEIVECVNLARVFEMTGTATCDFLKMDVEGQELGILRDTPLELLRRICALAMEWHYPQERLSEVLEHLEAAGFRTKTETVGHAQKQVMVKAWQE